MSKSKLTNIELPPDCQHPHWNVDNHNVGMCILWEGNGKPEVLEPGISLTKEDPKNLPREVKAAIARFAKQSGIGAAMKATGLEMHVIRAWVGAYCRTKTKAEDKGKTVGAQITLHRFNQVDCFICDGPVFSDTEWKAHFLETSNGRVWLCGVCADGIKRLMELLGISCQIV